MLWVSIFIVVVDYVRSYFCLGVRVFRDLLVEIRIRWILFGNNRVILIVLIIVVRKTTEGA